MHEPDESPPLVGSPRHLRKRALRREVAGASMAGSAADNRQGPEYAGSPEREATSSPSPRRAFGRKRLVALFIVILIALSISALALALISGG